MDQNDYIRIVPGADTGVLFIHGIAGTPEHFTKLIPLVQMVPESYSVYNLLLDGHGKTAKDFGKSSMKIWKRQVLDAFEMLRRSIVASFWWDILWERCLLFNLLWSIPRA